MIFVRLCMCAPLFFFVLCVVPFLSKSLTVSAHNECTGNAIRKWTAMTWPEKEKLEREKEASVEGEKETKHLIALRVHVQL